MTKVEISVPDQSSSIRVSAEIEDGREGDTHKFTLISPDGAVVSTGTVDTINNQATFLFENKNVKFWWPVGLGGRPLYTVEAQLFRDVPVEDDHSGIA